MNRHFHMDEVLFSRWEDVLLDHAYDWKQIGISNDYCNSISVPVCGIELVHWGYRKFNIIDEKKYMLFLLRYQ